MQESMNKFYKKNKKRLSLEDKNLRNKDKIISFDRTIDEEIAKEKAEQSLKAFDLDPKYGPCKGISRMKRYQNAVRLNLNPPNYLKNMIEKFGLNNSYYDNFI